MNIVAQFTEAMQKIAKSNGNNGNSGNNPTPTTLCVVPVTINRRGNNGNKNTTAVPVAKVAGTRNGNAANPHGSKLVPPVPAIPLGNDQEDSSCPLHTLYTTGIYAEPFPTKGLVLHCDYAVSESLKAHIILWTAGQWDALMKGIGWTGPELPRRVLVKSRNRYPLSRRAQGEHSVKIIIDARDPPLVFGMSATV